MISKPKNLLLAVLTSLIALQCRAQIPYAQQLREINQQIADAYLHHDNAGLQRIYAPNAVLMPEYHVTLFGTHAIAGYHTAWMDSVKTTFYSRHTHNVTKEGNYLVEMGTFSNHFTLRGRLNDYEGKYLNVWYIKARDRLELLWEITGSSKYLQRAALPLSALEVPDTAHLPKPTPNQKTTGEIQALNDQVAALVVQRKGYEFAKFYTENAIYAPYYIPMQIGKAVIDTYYREHEDPNSLISSVRIRATDVIASGDYVLVNALYQVDWGGATGAQGTVTGKNITIWKRMTDGHLLICRQMTAHD